jgi:hypothetical protein
MMKGEENFEANEQKIVSCIYLWMDSFHVIVATGKVETVIGAMKKARS